MKLKWSSNRSPEVLSTARRRDASSNSLRPVLVVGTHTTDPIHFNTHDQSLLSWPTIRIFIQAKKTFRQLVNVRVGVRAGDLPSAVEDRVRLRVVAVLHRDNHTRIAAYVVRFPSSLGRVEKQLVTLNVHPNHRDLRLALSVERHNVTVCLILENRPPRLRARYRPRSTPFLCSLR